MKNVENVLAAILQTYPEQVIQLRQTTDNAWQAVLKWEQGANVASGYSEASVEMAIAELYAELLRRAAERLKEAQAFESRLRPPALASDGEVTP